MGQPKLSTADNVLTPSFPRSLQQDDRLTDADDLAAARIAERFAPNVQPIAAPNERKFDQPAQQPVSTRKLRALITVLAIVALLPGLIVGTMLWLGPVSTYLPMAANFGARAHPSIQSGSVTGMPLPVGHQPESAAVLPVALAAPVILEATAGGDISFALALSHTNGLPTRSIIDIQGLPHRSTLSSGRPHGEGGWYLRPEEIAGLRLTLPDDAKGEATLEISLLTPGGEDIASAKTRLKMKPKPDASEAVAAHKYDEHRLNQGVRPFVTEAIDSSLAMLALEVADEAIVASRSEPTAEQPQEPTAEQPQESTSNTATAKPDNQEAVKTEDATKAPAQNSEDKDESLITLSEFVNLREGPSSSRRVIGVMNKGSKLRVIGRKRGWLKVTDAASSQTGWIYSRYAYSARKSRYAMQTAAPSRLGSPISEPESDSSFFTRLERWVVGP